MDEKQIEQQLKENLGSHKAVADYLGMSERTYARARAEGYQDESSQKHYRRVLELAWLAIQEERRCKLDS